MAENNSDFEEVNLLIGTVLHNREVNKRILNEQLLKAKENGSIVQVGNLSFRWQNGEWTVVPDSK